MRHARTNRKAKSMLEDCSARRVRQFRDYLVDEHNPFINGPYGPVHDEPTIRATIAWLDEEFAQHGPRFAGRQKIEERRKRPRIRFT